MSRPLRIGLLWHSSNSGNLGVGALTVSNIALVDEIAAELGREIEYVIMGPQEQGRAYVKAPNITELPIDTRTLLDPRRYWRKIGTLDGVIDIGGGDSFAEVYGPKRFGFLWLTKMMAIARRRPLMLAPQTIGPFTRQPWIALARAAMSRSTAVVARDPLSFDAIGEIAPTARRVQAIDVAFALPYQPAPQTGSKKLRIGLNVSGFLFNMSPENRKAFGLDIDYARLSRTLLRELTRRAEVEVNLIVHVVSDELAEDDDARVADLLAREFPHAKRVPNFASPSAAKSFISDLELLIAGRMHACIAAFSSGVPVLPISYSRKFSGLFEGVLGYQHGVPVKGMDTDAALGYLHMAIERRLELKAEIEATTPKFKAGLDAYRSELRRFLKAL